MALLMGMLPAAVGARWVPLAVELGEPIRYRCAGGRQLEVRYGRLSDGSLSFARLQPPGDQPHTLPQLVSGSGTRYTDEQRWQWWSKGQEGVLQRRDGQGQWQTVLDQCQADGQ
jgi:membrane-bound inhibitor of C-type lysozyme